MLLNYFSKNINKGRRFCIAGFRLFLFELLPMPSSLKQYLLITGACLWCIWLYPLHSYNNLHL